MKESLRVVVLLAALAVAGCSSPPMPITDKAIDAALTPPAMDVLRVQAKSIQHPLLAPLEIQGDALTPDEAAVVAVLCNPSLKAIRDGRGVAAAQLLQAGLLPNPSLTFGNEFPYSGPDHLVAYSVGIDWEISALISYKAKVDAAKSTASSVDLDIAWQEWQVAQQAKGAAYKVLSLQEQLEVARQADKLLRENQQTVQKALDLQQKTAVDLSAAQVGWQEAHTTVLELERDLVKQQIALERLLGRNGQAPTPLRKQAFTGPQPPQAAGLSAGLEDRRLDLLALRRGYDSQEATVRAAVLSRFPKTTAGASIARDTAGSATAGYSVAMDVPIFDSNQGNIAIERATRQKLFDEFVNRVFEGRNDIASGAAEIESLQRQVAFAQSAVPVLERLVADYGKALNAGSADVISYYSAYNDLDKKRIEVLKLRQELIDAWISLENASGMYLTGPTAASMPAGSMPTSHPTSQGAAQ